MPPRRPIGPSLPRFPGGPVFPIDPTGPGSPVSPTGPIGPAVPFGPEGPIDPSLPSLSLSSCTNILEELFSLTWRFWPHPSALIIDACNNLTILFYSTKTIEVSMFFAV